MSCRTLIAVLGFVLSAQAQMVLDNFSASSLRKIPDGRDVWSTVLAEDSDQSYSLENGMLKIVGSKYTGCGTTGCGLYMHFMPYPYVLPNGFVRAWQSGTWDPNVNRLNFKFKCSKNVPGENDGSYSFHIGTYVKRTSDTGDNNQGQHYYHHFDPNVYANQWIYVEVTRLPQHKVSQNSSANWPENPELSSSGVNYFDGLTRFYFDTTGGGKWSGQTCWFDDFVFEKKAGEPDTHVGGTTATYNGSSYEVRWNAPKNTVTTYEVRYSNASMKTAGFTSGVDGGRTSSPGSAYTVTYWKSPNRSNTQDLYVAIRPVGQSAFREIRIPGTSGSTVPVPCDLDGNGLVQSADAQRAIDAALGKTSCTADLDGSGQCDVVDVQRVVNASLGGSCRTGQ